MSISSPQTARNCPICGTRLPPYSGADHAPTAAFPAGAWPRDRFCGIGGVPKSPDSTNSCRPTTMDDLWESLLPTRPNGHIPEWTPTAATPCEVCGEVVMMREVETGLARRGGKQTRRTQERRHREHHRFPTARR